MAFADPSIYYSAIGPVEIACRRASGGTAILLETIVGHPTVAIEIYR